MHYLFYFGHPAQYLFLRETIRRLSRSDTHKITILIKTKDVLETLIRNDGLPYTNILTKKRRGGHVFIILSYVERLLQIIPILIREKPDLLVGTDATLAQLGKLFGIDRITIVEDDYEIIKKLANVTYPFTQTILCPEVCRVGAWTAKKVGYKGYMKLGYLHPAVFTPDPAVCKNYLLSNRYVIIRLSGLSAHHDFGIRGINAELLQQIIRVIEDNRYDVKLSAESTVPAGLEQYRLQIDPSDMHHVLAQAALLISDSQSMSVEAAMLGVPSIRYSDFARKISVLEELEHTYKLTYGILPGGETQLLTLLATLLEQPDLQPVYRERQRAMLHDKINVTDFLVWFLENYPTSVQLTKADPNYQPALHA